MIDRGPASGKVVLVTGASAGLGRATAHALARQGAAVRILCRDGARGEEALGEIREQSGNGDVRLWVADLRSQAAIRGFARSFKEAETRLDVLVHNAGVYRFAYHETPDRIEETLAVNHLAPFLLTHLLMPLLSATPGARIAVVSSDAHAHAGLDFSDLQGLMAYDGYFAYAQSKLANLLFTYALARRLGASGPTVNAVAPGVLATDIVRDLPEGLREKWSRMGKSAAEGARVVVRLALAPELAGVTGRYFRDTGEAASSPLSRDEETQEKLWSVSARMTEISP